MKIGVDVFAFDTDLLRGEDGEQCFEQVMGKVWLSLHRISPFDLLRLTQESRPTKTELPLEALKMKHYAEKLMIKNGEKFLATAWGDAFISAESYLIYDAHRAEISNLSQMKSSGLIEESAPWFDVVLPARRRMMVYSENPPLASDFKEESEGSKSAAWISDKRSVLLPNDQNHQIEAITIEEEGECKQTHLKRNDRHLIDVSNYLSEQSALVNEALGNNNYLGDALVASSTNTVTQFFSPEQMRLLLKPVLRLDEKAEEGIVNPWCPRFTEAFWIKVAPRMGNWSNYFPVDSLSASKTTFRFGSQTYHAEKRLGSGTYGTIYLTRLLPPKGENAPAMAGLTDTTIVGCFPEQQQLAGNPVFGEGILRVVKLESPDSPLEFYHMREARRRVVAAFNRSAIAIDVRSSICPALALAHCVGQFSSILMPYFPVGLLDFLNYGLEFGRRPTTKKWPTSFHGRRLEPPPPLTNREEELVALYLALELLWMAEGLHKHARMIHGDIKPDNFRINDKFPMLDTSALVDISDFSDEEERSTFEKSGNRANEFISCLDSGLRTKVLVLLDFGLCIDMARFPPGTVFAVDEERSFKRSFPCIEMLTGCAWTFQLDLFNIAGVIYTLVFKRYMKVDCINGKWIPGYMPRTDRVYRAANIWREILSALLNVRSCAPEDYPDVELLRGSCEVFLRENAADYNLAAEKANAIIHFLTSPSA